MKTSMMSNLAGLGIGSVAALCVGWSGLSYAVDVGANFTTVSKASVNIQSYEQAANGEVEKVKVDTNTVILDLTGDASSKPPKNYQLVLLNYCGAPENGSALAVWDKDTDGLVDGAQMACLDREGSVVFNEKKMKSYQGLDIDANHFGMDEIDMEVEIKGGKVKKNLDSSQPVCLKKFKTLAMSGYYSDGDGVPGTRAMKKPGSIKTNGGVFEIIPGDVVFNYCD
jgi:hypothetical protein